MCVHRTDTHSPYKQQQRQHIVSYPDRQSSPCREALCIANAACVVLPSPGPLSPSSTTTSNHSPSPIHPADPPLANFHNAYAAYEDPDPLLVKSQHMAVDGAGEQHARCMQGQRRRCMYLVMGAISAHVDPIHIRVNAARSSVNRHGAVSILPFLTFYFAFSSGLIA